MNVKDRIGRAIAKLREARQERTADRFTRYLDFVKLVASGQPFSNEDFDAHVQGMEQLGYTDPEIFESDVDVQLELDADADAEARYEADQAALAAEQAEANTQLGIARKAAKDAETRTRVVQGKISTLHENARTRRIHRSANPRLCDPDPVKAAAHRLPAVPRAVAVDRAEAPHASNVHEPHPGHRLATDY